MKSFSRICLASIRRGSAPFQIRAVFAFTTGGQKIFAKSVKGSPGKFYFRDGLAASQNAINGYFRTALTTVIDALAAAALRRGVE